MARKTSSESLTAAPALAAPQPSALNPEELLLLAKMTEAIQVLAAEIVVLKTKAATAS